MSTRERRSIEEKASSGSPTAFFRDASEPLKALLIAFAAAASVLASAALILTFERRIEPTATASFDHDDPRALANLLAAVCGQTFASSLPEEAPFLSGNVAAMSKMMTAMAITPSGDIDRDFAALMAPHHQGAIEMANLELRYGSNPMLRGLAAKVVVDRQQEIAAMRLALNQPPPAQR